MPRAQRVSSIQAQARRRPVALMPSSTFVAGTTVSSTPSVRSVARDGASELVQPDIKPDVAPNPLCVKQEDVGAAMPVARRAEVVAGRRHERELVGDVAAVHGKAIGRVVEGRGGACVELQPGEVDEVVPGESIDVVAEDVARQRRILDFELGVPGESDVLGPSAPSAAMSRVPASNFVPPV